MWHTFPLVFEYLNGATASSLHEAMLINEHMGTQAHSYFPVYLEEEMSQVAYLSSHITFNSLSQFHKFYPYLRDHHPEVSLGLRVNPGFSKVAVDMYNPTAPGSRLGIDPALLQAGLPEGIEGLHFHALCESSSYDLEETLAVFEEKCGSLLQQVKWVNMGGGHLMTRTGYDIQHLISLLKKFKERYSTLMTDVSFTAHMPDTLEMPYRPEIAGAFQDPTLGNYAYRIGGTSCLSGDFMYEYGFELEPRIGDKLIFRDMIHYTIVKTTMFNGVKHPDIGIIRKNGRYEVLRHFEYIDYAQRMD